MSVSACERACSPPVYTPRSSGRFDQLGVLITLNAAPRHRGARPGQHAALWAALCLQPLEPAVVCRMSVRIRGIGSNASRAWRRPGDTLPLMGGAYTLLALVVVLLLTAAEFGFALYAFRSCLPLVLPLARTLLASQMRICA